MFWFHGRSICVKRSVYNIADTNYRKLSYLQKITVFYHHGDVLACGYENFSTLLAGLTLLFDFGFVGLPMQ